MSLSHNSSPNLAWCVARDSSLRDQIGKVPDHFVSQYVYQHNLKELEFSPASVFPDTYKTFETQVHRDLRFHPFFW